MVSDHFVSRGGEKLQAAIGNWSASRRMKIENLTCLDVGSSTGGFVDCLLQNGAKKVYALDTAYGELAWKLRNDPRVVVIERTNILHMQSLPKTNTSGESKPTPEVAKVDLITIDAGWTKLELVLPVVQKFLKEGGIIIALLKPHYEADKKLLIKGVLSSELAEKVKDEAVKRIKDLGFMIYDQMESPILGGGGNKEFLLYIKI